MVKEKPSYDPECYALAEHFLHDEPIEDRELYAMHCHDLATTIQNAVESFFFMAQLQQRIDP